MRAIEALRRLLAGKKPGEEQLYAILLGTVQSGVVSLDAPAAREFIQFALAQAQPHVARLLEYSDKEAWAERVRSLNWPARESYRALADCHGEVRASWEFVNFLCEKLNASSLESVQGFAFSAQFNDVVLEAITEYSEKRGILSEREMALREEDIRLVKETPLHRPAGTPFENVVLRESILAPTLRCLDDIAFAAGALHSPGKPPGDHAARAAEVSARSAMIEVSTTHYYSSQGKPPRVQKAAMSAGLRAGLSAAREQLKWLSERGLLPFRPASGL